MKTRLISIGLIGLLSLVAILAAFLVARPQILLAQARTNNLLYAKAMLLLGAKPTASDRQGLTALHFAARHGNIPMAKLLIQAGADVNKPDDGGIPPIYYACGPESAVIQRMLLEACAHVNWANNGGWTPLMGVTAIGRQDQVDLLIAFGALVNAVDRIEGRTALMVAAREGHLGIAEQLLKSGADVNIRDFRNHTAIDYALENGHPDVAELLRPLLSSNTPEGEVRTNLQILAGEGGT
ncbi:MAG: ankyrin repeat domain-containing protein [bacterium]